MIWRLAAILFLLSLPAQAQGPRDCAPHDINTRFLAETVGEEIVWRGQMDEQRMIELWVSPDEAGTWTIVGVHTDGVACILHGGVGWGKAVAPSKKKKGKTA